MGQAVLDIAMRYVHVVCFVIVVGGMVFISIAIKPSLKLLTDEQSSAFQKAFAARFHRVVYICFAGLFVSGAYNWINLAGAYKEVGPKANIVIGIKALLAVVAFAIIWLRSIGLLKVPGKTCHLINLHLAAIIMLLAGLLRYWRMGLDGG